MLFLDSVFQNRPPFSPPGILRGMPPSSSYGWNRGFMKRQPKIITQQTGRQRLSWTDGGWNIENPDIRVPKGKVLW